MRNMSYCIKETRTNRKNGDLSQVYLHDCVIAQVRLEGDTLVFLLPEGLTVRPWADCNGTGRFLQTDAAQIRLLQAENPETVTGGTFEIIDHSYDPEKGIYTLHMVPGGPGSMNHARRYAFPCAGVEYRFGALVGDAAVQIQTDRHMESMREYIRKGHGMAVLQMRNVSVDAQEPYVGMMADAMSRDDRYDRQGNVERTQYLFDLFDIFTEECRAKIIEGVLSREREQGMAGLVPYVPVLQEFAGRGVQQAEQMLEMMYRQYLEAWQTRTEIPRGYDELAEIVWFLSDALGKPQPEQMQQEHTVKPRPPVPEITLETLIGTAKASSETLFHPVRYRKFIRGLTPEETEKLAYAAERESDPKGSAKLYSLFAETEYPHDPTDLISLARQWAGYLSIGAEEYEFSERQHRITAFCLIRALARLRHPDIRAFCFELMERREEYLYPYVMELWVANFSETEDYDRLCGFLEEIPPWEKELGLRHEVEYSLLHGLYRQKYEDPRMYGFLTDIFIHTYCSSCRSTAVKILIEHGMLQEQVRRECLYDCEPATREMAAKAVCNGKQA